MKTDRSSAGDSQRPPYGRELSLDIDQGAMMKIQRASSFASPRVSPLRRSFEKKPLHVFFGAVLACAVGMLGALPSDAQAQCCKLDGGSCENFGSLLCTSLGGTSYPGECEVDCPFPGICFEMCVQNVPTPGPGDVCCEAPPQYGPACNYADQETCILTEGIPRPGLECPPIDCDGGVCASNCAPASTPTSTPPPTPTPTPPPVVCCEAPADSPPSCRYFDEQYCTSLGGIPQVGYECLDPQCTGSGCSNCVPPGSTRTPTPAPVCCNLNSGGPVCTTNTAQACGFAGGVAAPAGYICTGSQCHGAFCVGQCIPADSTPTPTLRPNVCCEVASGGPYCAHVNEQTCGLAGGIAAPDGHICQANGQCEPGPQATPTATQTQVNTPMETPTPAVCGNGAVESGEDCDDGNTDPGDGCDATCADEPGCPLAVDLTCRVPIAAGKASIALVAGSPDKSQLLWKWLAGSATDKAELGNPLASDGYLVCLYDGNGLRATLRAPAGGTCDDKPCWKDKPYGYLYKDAGKTPDGISLLKLKQGADGQAKIKIKAQGANLPMPATSSLLSPLTVQLRRASAGPCWSASYVAPYDKDDGVNLKDKAD